MKKSKLWNLTLYIVFPYIHKRNCIPQLSCQKMYVQYLMCSNIKNKIISPIQIITDPKIICTGFEGSKRKKLVRKIKGKGCSTNLLDVLSMKTLDCNQFFYFCPAISQTSTKRMPVKSWNLNRVTWFSYSGNPTDKNAPSTSSIFWGNF